MRDRKAFVDVAYRLNANDPNWVPPLRAEVHGLLDRTRNPWFQHAQAQLFVAWRGGKAVGRISAQIDQLVLAMPPEQGGGAGLGQWGLFEAEDDAVAQTLFAAVEGWLRDHGMTRASGPFSLSVWDEVGLLIQGHDRPPTVMMAHNPAGYQAMVEAAGYHGVRDLYTYDLSITQAFPPLVQRIVQSGERNPRIVVRKVDKRRFDQEAALILGILNDAWGDNWGFVPLTDAEIAFAGKKLKPIVFDDLIRIAEVDGEPVAFMLTLPDLNEKLIGYGGSLWPINWAKMLWWLRAPRATTIRVPLMGVVRRFQATRLASQLAFMMIEYTRRDAVENYGVSRGEIGWILEDNQGMRSIAETIESRINRVYRIYSKAL